MRMSALGQKRTCALQNVMSALPLKADICGAVPHVCFGPKADSCTAAKGDCYSITSSARPSNESGMVRPSVFAILRLMTNSTFTACWTGRSAGLAPLRILLATIAGLQTTCEDHD